MMRFPFFCLLYFSIFISSNLFAQTPTSCFEIESILANSCDGTVEGKNEMFTFHVGNTALNMANFFVGAYATGNVNWNSASGNIYRGICQNATTAQKVLDLNATITSCGQLIEPPLGIIPAGAKVIFMLSVDFDPSANDFSNLSETYYIVFQCAGNTSGHFVNSGSSTRKLKIGFSSPAACTDEVTYMPDDLIGGDGATVNFSWPGSPTYINNGCQPPVILPSVSSTYTNASSVGKVCNGSEIELSGIASNNFSSYTWSGGTGTFSSTTTKNTSYTANINESGTVVLTFTATSSCTATNNGVSTISIYVKQPPTASITGNNSICTGQNTTLFSNSQTLENGPFTYIWSPSGTTNQNLTTNLIGTHTVTISNSCGNTTSAPFLVSYSSGGDASFLPGSQTFCESEGIINLVPNNAGGTFTINPPTSAFDATAKTFNPALADKNVFYTITYSTSGSCGDTKSNVYSVSIGKLAKISVSKPAPYCKGETITLSSSVTDGNTWSTGETTNTIQVKTANTYSLSVSGCNNSTSSDKIDIQFSSIKADFEPSIKEGNAPLEVAFIDKSENANTYFWEFGDNSASSDLKSPTHSYVKEGEYTVTLNIKNTDGCTDTTSYKFIKVSENISLIIPNIFSPNNDKINDFFTIKSSGVKAFSCVIYSRWGKQVAKLEDINATWDGGNYSDGVYFYIMNVTFIDDTTKEYNGNVTLLR